MNRKEKRTRLKQPCHCGSGVRYDKCHYRRDNVAQGAIRIFQEKVNTRELFIGNHGHIRKPQLLKMGDRHIVTIGNQIFQQINPGPYNFVNAIIDCALHVFGDIFLEAEENKPFEDRHPAIQWLHAYSDHHNNTLAREDAKPEDFQFGIGAAWIRLAYDLYTIRDNAELQEIMCKRILNPDTFQAARHELWVAALFVAAGFEINFENESDNSKRHPEFIAMEKETGIEVAVEAKSRRRQGIKGFTGGNPFTKADKVGARGLVLDAYKKSGDIPLYVFIDVNLPPAPEEQQQAWFQELDDMMNDLAVEGYYDPCPAHAIFFHNDPSHFIDRLISNDTDKLWIKHYEDKNPDKLFPENIVQRIMTAHNQRAIPPENVPDF
ncbi:MAG: SEC-C domain-containing protein [Alphaproteobacteria bacterium]